MRPRFSLKQRIALTYILLAVIVAGAFSLVSYISVAIIEEQIINARLTQLEGRMIDFQQSGQLPDMSPDMRMLVVQLPNFGERSDRPVDAGWAQIREEERRAVAADGNAALVPTLDVGLNDDLHPPNKLPIGLRLAMAAEGEMPLPTHVAKLGEGYAVFMEGIGGRLHTWSGDRVLGVELCAETQASCRYAEAVATLNGLLVADDGKPATRIRYAWSDAPVVNLSDGRGVPIPGFELPVAR